MQKIVPTLLTQISPGGHAEFVQGLPLPPPAWFLTQTKAKSGCVWVHMHAPPASRPQSSEPTVHV